MNTRRNGTSCDPAPGGATTVEPEICPPGEAYPMHHRTGSPITCNLNQLVSNPCFWLVLAFGAGVYAGYKLRGNGK